MTDSSNKMPVVFIGHGSPMNAVAKNDFTEMLERLGKKIPRPSAILCISAHWMTEGVWATAMERPRTIHDFGGFPQALFDIRYPAPGSPAFVEKIARLFTDPKLFLDQQDWGLDHGTWSILVHMYPKADIPVVQLSLDLAKSSEFHFKLGELLRPLRREGVLILGSGNVVHNLRQMNWDAHAPAHDWAIEFDQWLEKKILQRDFKGIISEAQKSREGKLSIPTPEHFYPLLYILGASETSDQLKFEFDSIHHASISMRSLSFGI